MQAPLSGHALPGRLASAPRDRCPRLGSGFVRIVRIDDLEAWRLLFVPVAAQTDEVVLTILRRVGNVQIEGMVAFATPKRQAQGLDLTLSSRKVFGHEVEDEFDI